MSTEAGTILEERRDPWYPGGQRDATIWVEEFFRTYPNGCLDADTMLGWFANAIETGVVVAAQEAGELDRAWAACEAALPAGWWFSVGNDAGGYRAYAAEYSASSRVELEGFVVGRGPTPAAALQELTRRLREHAG